MKEFVCRRVLGFGFLIGSLAFASVKVSATTAAPFKLAWDASSDKSVAGYAIYYGLVDSPATNRLDVGMTLATTFSDLEANSNYIFAVVAYKKNGAESSPSNLLVYSPPALSRLKIAPLAGVRSDIQFRAAVGSLCRVEYSATMGASDWHTLGSANADTTGEVTLNDPLLDHPMMRFYRGVVLQP